MISLRELSKHFGPVRAVDGLNFDAESGKVTGFLGPNGAGKSTTLRMVMGLDRPTSGDATIDGKRYADLAAPLTRVGALLDAGAMHPGRTGRAHLRIAARASGLPRSRVDAVLDQVGLGDAARRRIRGYSLGMRQRLGIAAALLGDPPVVVFDEPMNGLDLDGVRWIRALLRGFADEGRTVLVSSHLMSEMQLVADRLVIIGRGRLVADASIDELLRGLAGPRVRVSSPRSEELHRCLEGRAAVSRVAPGALEVIGLGAPEIGDLAHAAGIPLHRLAEAEQSLEEAFLTLTEDSLDYAGRSAAPPAGRGR